MIQTLVHTCRGLGCSIFIETYVKRQSNPLPFKVCSIQQCTEHIQPSTVISKNDSKKCVHFGTTARVIRVNKFKSPCRFCKADSGSGTALRKNSWIRFRKKLMRIYPIPGLLLCAEHAHYVGAWGVPTV